MVKMVFVMMAMRVKAVIYGVIDDEDGVDDDAADDDDDDHGDSSGECWWFRV